MDSVTILAILILFLCVVLVWAQCRLNYHRERADEWKQWARAQMRATDHYRRKLDEAERDMATMVDCCDICGNSNNPNCPGDDCETCGVECECRECRNSGKFAWRGLYETERRSGIYDTGGKTDEGGGDRQGTAESVSSAQAGDGMPKGEA